MLGIIQQMALMIDASDLLKGLLKENHLTQAEFAALAGVTVATVSRWVNGHSLADARKISAAIAALGQDPREYDINLPRPTLSNHQLTELITTLGENQRRQHEELLAALTEIRTAIDVLRSRR